MLKKLKQFCLKNWDLAVKWEAWSILKDNNVEEDSQLLFLLLDKGSGYKMKTGGKQNRYEENFPDTEDCKSNNYGTQCVRHKLRDDWRKVMFRCTRVPWNFLSYILV